MLSKTVCLLCASRRPPCDLVEILCNDTPLDPSLSLATVSTFVWKRGDDVQLYYRLKKGATVRTDGGISSA